jgi:hypothetical protein
MLVRVRGVLVTTLLAACSFDHGVATTDGAVPPDMPPDVVTPTWDIDAMSKKGVPGAPFEWSNLLAVTGVQTQPPDHVWLMQESTGSLADSVGAINLDPLNAPSYRNAVSGWSRAAVGTHDTNANQGFLSTATGNLNGPAYLLLLYMAVASTPNSERSLVGIGAGSDHRYVSLTSAPVFKGTGIGVTPATGVVDPMASAHPIVIKLDPTALTYTVYTDQEKLSVGWTGTGGTGGLFILGNAIVGAAEARYLYGALWVGQSARIDDASVKKLLKGLGWTVTGY